MYLIVYVYVYTGKPAFQTKHRQRNKFPAGLIYSSELMLVRKTCLTTKPRHRNNFSNNLFLRLSLRFRQKPVFKLNISKEINFAGDIFIRPILGPPPTHTHKPALKLNLCKRNKFPRCGRGK